VLASDSETVTLAGAVAVILLGNRNTMTSATAMTSASCMSWTLARMMAVHVRSSIV
jgi:hypothetical protein